MDIEIKDVKEEHQCRVMGCDNKWKSGIGNSYACEEHEDLLFSDFGFNVEVVV